MMQISSMPESMRLLADDLDDRLGQPVTIDQRKHLLLDRGGRRVLAGSRDRPR